MQVCLSAQAELIFVCIKAVLMLCLSWLLPCVTALVECVAASAGRVCCRCCVRFELEDVMMTAIGSCGHISHLALPHLEQFSRLERLLLTLPVVHRVRLLALMVVSVLNNR